MAIQQQLTFFATAPKFLNELLATELTTLGAEVLAIKTAGVAFKGDLSNAYRACLWSRVANRILYPLLTFSADSPEALYHGVQQIDWSQHFNIDKTFAVDFSTRDSKITHTQFGAQKVKDAIVDQFRSKYGDRPNVEREKPNVMINVYCHRDVATVSIDLSGESLHKRGYRKGQGEAPLKENLAAAILLRAGWPQIAVKGGALVDLMCGAATIPIEAALIAGNIAPGLLRDYFGFLGWKPHNHTLWNTLCEEARANKTPIHSPIVGYDADPYVVHQALANIQQAGLSKTIHIEKRELAHLELNPQLQKHAGIVIANPPYGERLSEAQALQFLYRNIGETLKKHFNGWLGAIFTGNPDLAKNLRLTAHKKYAFYNGPIVCKLLLSDIKKPIKEIAAPTSSARNDIETEPRVKASGASRAQNDSCSVIPRSSKGDVGISKNARDEIATAASQPRNDIYNKTRPLNDNIQMFINRLQKNIKHLGKWAKRENISCYRLYDADLPEYAMAIDRYENYCHVQEYAPPKTIDSDKAEQRLEDVLTLLPEILNIPAKNIFIKSRFKQTREIQYEKLAQHNKLIVVHEGGSQFLVNFTDYVDTGIFLDQRYVRQKIAEVCNGKYFLNLFAYTGTATVYAAKGGAAHTTTVDMSATYIMWAKQNLALNGYSEQKHAFIQADCLTWIQQATKKYDVIFVAPPVFSRSKRMEAIFDIDQDHIGLLINVKKLLAKRGVIIFATHKKNFKLSPMLLQHFQITDWKQTLPLDYQRSKNAYYCWLLSPRG